MKIAIIISGYLRSFQNNISHFINNLIQNHKVDIYIHKTKNEKNDKYNNKTDWEYIKNKLNPKVIVESEDIQFSKSITLNNILNQFYKFYILNKIKNITMEQKNITYDLVIKWRPDILLNKKIDFTNIQKNTIYIPNDAKIDLTKLKNPNDKYLCDIIAYGNNNIMNYYFDFYKSINKLTKVHGFCQETLLYYYLQNTTNQELNIDYSVILSTCNIISISGNSGSGKTTLSSFLQKDISGSFILECDRYHKWERNDEHWKKMTHLNPQANYLTKMQKDVFDLKIGKNIYQVDYNHKDGNFTSEECIESKDTVIVCGLHTLYNNNSNINIFMDTMKDLNKYWKVKRDIKKRGYSVEKVLKNIKDRLSDYEKYILPQKNNADIIINFYTDDKISFDNLERNYKIKLNIFIKNKFNILKKLIRFDNIHITEQDNYYKLNISDEVDYYEIIKNVVKSLNIK